MVKIEAISLVKIIFIPFLVLLVFTGATDADLFDQERINNNSWQAVTLDFSQRNTANNNMISLLFNTSGLLPDGFQVKAVRVKKDGQLDFNYRISIEKTAGYDPFCNSLKIVAMKDWQKEYQGNLVSFFLDDQMSDEGKRDWIFFIGLENNDADLKNKVCDFNLIFSSWRGEPGNSQGLHDQEVLANHIVAGVWQN